MTSDFRCALASALIACRTHWRSALALPVAAAGGRLQVDLPANLAVRIRDRVDVDIRPAVEQRLDEIAGTGNAGAPPARLFWSSVIRIGPSTPGAAW